MRFLIRYPLLIADEEELHCVTTTTRLKRFERKIRQENKGILGEKREVLIKVCRKLKICHLRVILVYFQLNNSDIFILPPFTGIHRSE